MKAERSLSVRFPIFEYEVRVIFTRDLVETSKRLGEKSDLRQARAVSLTFEEHPRTGWLVFDLAPSPGTIAHEAAHAIFALARAAGTTLDEETFSYHQGHLVERIHAFLTRPKPRPRKSARREPQPLRHHPDIQPV